MESIDNEWEGDLALATTLEKVSSLIKEQFPDADVDDVKENESRQVSGIIWWAGFKRMALRERNRLVHERVRNTLGLAGVNVGLLFPLAPGENLDEA